MKLTSTISTGGLERLIVGVEKAIPAGLNAAAEVLCDQYVRDLGRNHGGRPSAPGQVPNTQSGNLRNSFGYVRAEFVDGRWVVHVGTDVLYAKHLNNGAVIRPRNGRAIAIPMNSEAKRMMDRAGGRARSVINALKFDRTRPIHFAKTPNGLLVLRALSRSRHGPMEPFILLTRRAVIQARPWAKPGLARAQARMAQTFSRAAKAAMAAAGGSP